MHEVGTGELERTPKRVAEAQPFDEDGRYDEAEERQPGEPGQHVQVDEERKRRKYEHAGAERQYRTLPARGGPCHERTACDVRQRAHRGADSNGEGKRLHLERESAAPATPASPGSSPIARARQKLCW